MSISRREFVKNTSLATSAFVIGFYAPIKARAKQVEKDNILEPNAFIQIDKDNTITFLIGQAEMGQGVYSTMSMCIADELDAAWEDIVFLPAPVNPIYNRPGMGIMLTGGSGSITNHQESIRKVGAAVRLMLKKAASKKWKVRVFDVTTKDSYVINKRTKEKLSYGSLVEDIKLMKVPNDVTLKKESEYNLIGKPMKRHPKEVDEKITGEAKFGIDVRVDDMKYAALVQPRVFGAKIKSYDDSKARKMDGVLKIKQIPNEKIAVIAKHWWQAKKASEQIKVVWDEGEFAKMSSKDISNEYEKILNKDDNPIMRQDGNVEKAFEKAYKVVEAKYEFPYLAHAMMEPLNCTVHHNKNRAFISLGSQFQTNVRNLCSEILGVDKDKVEYYNNYLGSSFGRRGPSNFDYVKDAIYVAKDEKWPVQTLWSREDDIKMGNYRPLTKAKVKLSIDKEGIITGFKGTIVNQSLAKGTIFEPFMFKDGIDATQREGFENHPYKIVNNDLRAFCPEYPIPVLWLRSVGHTVSAPVVDCIIDQAAVAANMDPIDFRIKNLKDERFVNLLKYVAKQSDWYNRKKDSGYGVAIAKSFGSIVAYVIKVKVENNDYKVENVWSAVDCGYAFNPLNVENQILSSVNFAIGYTKYAQITIKNGKAEQNNFYDYEVNRIGDTPNINVGIINSGAKLGGIGEPGVPPVFPAIANALYDATKKRYTTYPIKLG
ncbi:twin-arginine translocation pathway signal protein [Malaciobacter molluscorum]|uniref:xanthine dehydrogenase family protein molybdopterin-binding subunit n=1 Tax=Malaciobacter molluscorum TaxID=1032072 RepID=UPI00100AF3B7|nr:molybdopterin cofactor-binding domain-containing protein [Malaciobacter molluscorum]RXJ96166.1 twin-arginine translocation pathway signal protein [Malaciobacter molluscorum]